MRNNRKPFPYLPQPVDSSLADQMSYAKRLTETLLKPSAEQAERRRLCSNYASFLMQRFHIQPHHNGLTVVLGFPAARNNAQAIWAWVKKQIEHQAILKLTDRAQTIRQLESKLRAALEDIAIS